MRPAATEDVACNLCGSTAHEAIGWRDREGQPLRTVMCRTCGLIFTNPRPPAAAIDGYYATEYRADYSGSAAPPLRKIVRGLMGAEDRCALLRPLLERCPAAGVEPARWRVLDVGAGAGELIYLLRQSGIDAEGLEPGREYAEFARRSLGLTIQTATVHEARVPDASFDLVTMFHALEHVGDPRQVLVRVRGWIRPGGLLVVEVPNVEARVQAPAHRFHYAHLFSFSGATLAAIGEAVGLRVVETTFSGDGGNVTAVFRREDDQPRPLPLSRLAARAAVTREILAGHSAIRHYVSPTPYRRVLDRLRRRWREDRLLRTLRSVDEALAWASRRARDLADPCKSRLH